MSRGMVNTVLVLCGFALGIVIGYQNIFDVHDSLIVTINPEAQAKPVVFIGRGTITAFDAARKIAVVSIQSPYNATMLMTISVTYDKNTKIWGADGSAVSPSLLKAGANIALSINRQSGPLYASLISFY